MTRRISALYISTSIAHTKKTVHHEIHRFKKSYERTFLKGKEFLFFVTTPAASWYPLHNSVLLARIHIWSHLLLRRFLICSSISRPNCFVSVVPIRIAYSLFSSKSVSNLSNTSYSNSWAWMKLSISLQWGSTCAHISPSEIYSMGYGTLVDGWKYCHASFVSELSRENMIRKIFYRLFIAYMIIYHNTFCIIL